MNKRSAIQSDPTAPRARRTRHHLRPGRRPGETWRPLEGWGAPYDVSDLGRVRKPAVAVERRRGGTQHYGEQLLRTYLRNGTPLVQLSLRPRRHRAVRVARLVAALFLPPRPPGAELVFANGDRRDVRAANLAWSVPPPPLPASALRRLLSAARSRRAAE
ncbi:MAG: HNH endonuclease [Kiritimatiellae bacterium]|nr:HNH endonuclease [Kiritimatiellia bacterium]